MILAEKRAYNNDKWMTENIIKGVEEMTWEEVLKLDIKELIEWINEQTSKGLTVTEVARNLGGRPATLTDKAKAKGYVFDKDNKIYILKDAEKMTAVTKEKKEVSDQSKTKVIEKTEEKKDTSHTKNNDNSHQRKLIRVNKDAGEDAGTKALESISENIKGIKELLEADREVKKSKDIVISLEDEEDTRTTIRVNAGAWKKFESFTLKNSEYKKKNLLSMALLEYVQNHK